MTKPKATKTAKDTMDITGLNIASARLRLATGQFDESKHPRDKGGQFTCKDCGAEHGSQRELNEHSKEHQYMQNPKSDTHYDYADNLIETFNSQSQAKSAGGKKPVQDEDTGLWYRDNREWQKSHDDENTIDIQTYRSADEAKKDGAKDPVLDEETGLYFSSNTSWQTAHGGANERAFEDKTLHLLKPKPRKTSAGDFENESVFTDKDASEFDKTMSSADKNKIFKIFDDHYNTNKGKVGGAIAKVKKEFPNLTKQERMYMLGVWATNFDFKNKKTPGLEKTPAEKGEDAVRKEKSDQVRKNLKDYEKNLTPAEKGERAVEREKRGSLDDLKLASNLVDLKIAANNFNETDHPRDDKGEFTSKGGGSSSGDGDPDDEGGDLSVNSAAEEIVSNLEMNPKMSMQQIKDELIDDGFDSDIVDQGWTKAEKNYDQILKKINREVLGDDWEDEDEFNPDDVSEGDLVDFGSYGKLYVVDKDYMMSNGRTWWVTDDLDEYKEKGSRASGWSIKPSHATKVIESADEREDNEDDDYDDDGKFAKYAKARTAKLLTGSQVDNFTTSNGDRYVSYFLLNDQENLKGWGVTTASIPKNVDTFKGMPFVITSKKFFADSPYGETTDHPSTEHFGTLGIKVGKDIPHAENDMMLQASFQERFRVGNIEEIIRASDGNYLAFIKVDPKFANHEMPPLVSPAIFQLNPMEPMNKIQTWVGMHLAGLDERPAYGNYAVYKGSCNGEKGACLRQLSASLPHFARALPECAMRKIFNARLKVATMQLQLMQMGAQTSSDHPQIQRLNVHKKTMGCKEKSY